MSPANEMALSALRVFDQQLPEEDPRGTLARDVEAFDAIGASSIELDMALRALLELGFIEEAGEDAYRITPAGRSAARSQSFHDHLFHRSRVAREDDEGRAPIVAAPAGERGATSGDRDGAVARPAPSVPAKPVAEAHPGAPPASAAAASARRFGAGLRFNLAVVLTLAAAGTAIWMLTRGDAILVDPKALTSPEPDADGCVAVLYSQWKFEQRSGGQGEAAAGLDQEIKAKLQALDKREFKLEVGWQADEAARQLQYSCYQACKLYMGATAPDSGIVPQERQGLFDSVKNCLDKHVQRPESQPRAHTLSMTVEGKGKIATGEGMICSSSCTAKQAAGNSVKLLAEADQRSTFVGWSGACGGAGECQITMDADKNVTAMFEPVTPKPTAPSPDGCAESYSRQSDGLWVIGCRCPGKPTKHSRPFIASAAVGTPEFMKGAREQKAREAWSCGESR